MFLIKYWQADDPCLLRYDVKNQRTSIKLKPVFQEEGKHTSQ